MTSEHGMKYVDKYGRKLSVTVDHSTGQYIFKRKDKIISAVNVDDLLLKLNQNKITYEEFEKEIAKSKVYTVFNKDIEIETWNVKAANKHSASKIKGFSLTRSIKNMFDATGEYMVRINHSGRQTLMEIKYALSNNLS